MPGTCFHDPLSDLGKEVVMNDIRAWIAAHLNGNLAA